MKIEACDIPENALIGNALPCIDYKDAYVGRFKSDRKLTSEDLFKVFFMASPGWITSLLKLRNRTVSFLGLKAPKVSGLPPVQDFRVSFHLVKINPEAPDEYSFTVSTTVNYHNPLGKLYFIPVKPFHKIIVPAMMRKTIESMEWVSGAETG